jgi:hypothetical protein
MNQGGRCCAQAPSKGRYPAASDRQKPAEGPIRAGAMLGTASFNLSDMPHPLCLLKLSSSLACEGFLLPKKSVGVGMWLIWRQNDPIPLLASPLNLVKSRSQAGAWEQDDPQCLSLIGAAPVSCQQPGLPATLGKQKNARDFRPGQDATKHNAVQLRLRGYRHRDGLGAEQRRPIEELHGGCVLVDRPGFVLVEQIVNVGLA